MTRVCTVCGHDERREIDAALVHREPYRHIASRFSVTTGTLQRHVKGGHIAELLLKAHDAQQAADADQLLADLETIRQAGLSLLDRAQRSFEWRAEAAAMRELRETLRILAELHGKLAAQGTTNILVQSPQWIELRTLIIGALEDHPAALLAVKRAIAQGEGNGRSDS